MQARARKSQGYFAPFPAGKGIMIVETEGYTHRVCAENIVDIITSNEKNETTIYIAKGKYYNHLRVETSPIAVEDMYMRAQRGEIARSAEYHENGARLDGTPLLISYDYSIKERLMLQRKAAQKNAITLDAETANAAADTNEIEEPLHPSLAVAEGGHTMDIEVPKAPELQMLPSKMNTTDGALCLRDKDYEVGDLVEGKGIFVGVYSVDFKKETGFLSSKKITREFNVFAAPEDLKDEMGQQFTGTFEEVLAAVARIENICGYAGIRVERNTPLQEMLISKESYKKLENWFVPNLKILRDMIHPNRAKGHLNGTFDTSAGDQSQLIFPAMYASLDFQSYVIDFHSGKRLDAKSAYQRSVRPIRLELKL